MSIGKFLGSVGSAISHAEKWVSKEVHKAESFVEHKVIEPADKFVSNLPKELVNLAGKAGLKLPGLPNLGDLYSTVENLPWEKLEPVLRLVMPPHVQDAEGKKFIQDSAAFRDTLSSVRSLRQQLDSLPAGDPRRPALEKKLAETASALQTKWGYTEQTAPKAGALWVDPQLMSKSLKDGQINGSTFRTGTPVTKPPSPEDALFSGGRTVTMTGADGKQITVRNAAEYKAAVAANRAAAGMPVTDGEPVGVHLSMQGGGGKGKRYSPAYAEMLRMGVVPTSVSGTSVGSIGAALFAAGADPKAVADFANDPRLKGWIDVDLNIKGGLANGQAAYDTLDQKLRELTGIKDRPVTFADLKLPCQIIGGIYADSNPPAGKSDLSKAENRVFVFSQETTPDTPVALAVRASMAIPGVWDPVQMVDPTTGREVQLVDGGVVEGLPMGYGHDGLPEIGMSLVGRDSGLAKGDNVKPGEALPKENLDANNLLWNVVNGLKLLHHSGVDSQDYGERMNPKAGTFMLSLPVWNLDDPSKADSTMSLPYDPNVDPALDVQSQAVTQEFLRNVLGKLRDPSARYTNTTNAVPEHLSFDVPVTVDGQSYRAQYAGGDKVVFTSDRAQRYELSLGKDKVEAMYLDGQAFHDLSSQLAFELKQKLGAQKKSDPLFAAA